MAHIGKMPIAEVTSEDVIGILAPILREKAPTARKLRQSIQAVLEWAVAMNLRPDNLCDRIVPVLGSQGNAVRHMRALPHGEVVSALRTVRASNTRPVVKLAFEFLVLTARCSGEVRGAAWTEIDREEGVWTIPAPRTKGNREHRVRLARRVLGILEEARALGGSSPLVFSRVGEKPIGNTAMSERLLGLRIAALAHKVRNPIKAAYRSTNLFERWRRLMDDWADYLDQLEAVSK